MEAIIAPADPAKCAADIVRLWNACLGKAFPMDERLFRQQTSLERDDYLLLAARREPEEPLNGAILVKRATRKDEKGTVPDTGYISFILTTPGARGKGMGSRLLEEAEAWCARRGVRTIIAGSDYCHFFPGLPLDDSSLSASAISFFSKRGYRQGQVEMDMIADLALLDLRLPRDGGFSCLGYRFSLCSPSLRPAALAFLSRCFPGRWESEISEAFSASMRDEDLGLAIRETDDAVVGFARIGDRGSPLLWPGLYWRGLLGASPGSLGPIGIDPACRGLGLGLDLLRASLAELKRRGVRNTVIDWTDLEDFYAKLGFVPWKRYRGMIKSLNAKS